MYAEPSLNTAQIRPSIDFLPTYLALEASEAEIMTISQLSDLEAFQLLPEYLNAYPDDALGSFTTSPPSPKDGQAFRSL